jgi:hypothetical protein
MRSEDLGACNALRSRAQPTLNANAKLNPKPPTLNTTAKLNPVCQTCGAWRAAFYRGQGRDLLRRLQGFRFRVYYRMCSLAIECVLLGFRFRVSHSVSCLGFRASSRSRACLLRPLCVRACVRAGRRAGERAGVRACVRAYVGLCEGLGL